MMFLDGYKISMYGQKGLRRHMDIGGWNCRWSSLRMWCLDYVDPRGALNMPLIRHAEEHSYVRRLLTFVRRFGEGTRFNAHDLCCWDRLFERFYLVQDAEHWWHKLDFEGRQRRNSSNVRFLSLHELRLFRLPQRDRDLLYAFVPEIGSMYESLKVLGVAVSVLFSYLNMFHKDGTEAEQSFVGRIAKLEFLVLVPSAFLWIEGSSAVFRMSFARMHRRFNCASALWRVPKGWSSLGSISEFYAYWPRSMSCPVLHCWRLRVSTRYIDMLLTVMFGSCMLAIWGPLSTFETEQSWVDIYGMAPKYELVAAMSEKCMSMRSLSVAWSRDLGRMR